MIRRTIQSIYQSLQPGTVWHIHHRLMSTERSIWTSNKSFLW